MLAKKDGSFFKTIFFLKLEIQHFWVKEDEKRFWIGNLEYSESRIPSQNCLQDNTIWFLYNLEILSRFSPRQSA